MIAESINRIFSSCTQSVKSGVWHREPISFGAHHDSRGHMAVSTELDSAALGSQLVLELSDSMKDHSKIHQLRLRPLKNYLAPVRTLPVKSHVSKTIKPHAGKSALPAPPSLPLHAQQGNRCGPARLFLPFPMLSSLHSCSNV